MSPSSLPQLPVSQGGLKFVLFGICINKPFELIKKKNQKQTRSHECLKSNWGLPDPLKRGGSQPRTPILELGWGCYCLNSTWFWSRDGASRDGGHRLALGPPIPTWHPGVPSGWRGHLLSPSPGRHNMVCAGQTASKQRREKHPEKHPPSKGAPRTPHPPASRAGLRPQLGMLLKALAVMSLSGGAGAPSP